MIGDDVDHAVIADRARQLGLIRHALRQLGLFAGQSVFDHERADADDRDQQHRGCGTGKDFSNPAACLFSAI